MAARDPDALCTIDPETLRILETSAGFADLFGVEGRAACGRSVLELAEEPEALRELLRAGAANTGGAFQTLRRGDGTSFPARVSVGGLAGAKSTALYLAATEVVTERVGDEALRLHVERTLRQEAALLTLLAHHDTDFEQRIRRILEVDASTLGVARVSFWSLGSGGGSLRCEMLYRLDSGSFESGVELGARDYPRYFSALRTGRLVVASDAHTDPKTSEFSAGYLAPAGIGAMLDVPVYTQGALVGVVCHEHVGGPRRWTVDEQQFAMSIGQMTSIAIEARERARAEEAVRQSEARFRAIVEAAPVPMLVVSAPDGRCLYGNAAASELSGVPVDEMIGKMAPDFYADPEERKVVLAELEERGHVTGRELRVRRADGTPYWVLLSLRRVSLDAGPAMVVGLVDVTPQKRLENALRTLALHDSLTSLPNRPSFLEALRREMGRAAREPGYGFGVLYVDLDGFKGINDALGHDVGDALLVSVSDRLRKNVRPMDLAARLGGDEFVVLVAGVGDSAEALAIATRLEAELRPPHRLGGHDVTATASIGVVVSRSGSGAPEDVLRDADAAMYKAKQAGRSRVAVAPERAAD